VLSGGTAYALDGSNTVFSDDIVNNEVQTQDIMDAGVTTDDFRGRSVTTDKIKKRAVSTGKLADGAVTTPKLGCAGNNPDDVMVKVGSVCVDRYEASIWDAPTGGNQITGEVPCNPNGQDCTDIYARSIAGVKPTTHINWLQARQALANSGKRMPTNAEWQMAVAGTPDSTDCNVSTGSLANTGANAACVSNWGANDMVGNLGEWVADWDEEAVACATWPGVDFGGDHSCIGRASGEPSTRRPGALLRGGDLDDGTSAGPFAVSGISKPSDSDVTIGFRGAR
jgi:formylglycine-generating enzyme required for sulfatase activity